VATPLEKENVTIGKQKGEVDLVLEDESVSRLHARIYVEDRIVYLEDLNSTNGTFKNGLRLQPYEKRRLEEGDEVRFGKLLFIYR
ncbi:MAG: FHA domain-containing protein, partial [Acetatifactor sp.]|nr:FHA domain-containing protein [Acetatifactor sp.]